MPAWKQNAPQIPPRNGTAPVKNAYPLSYTVYGPQEIPPSQENPAGVSAYGGYRAVPLQVDVVPSFGRHDGLQGRLMEVSQADLYTQPPAGWTFPRAGTWEEPGGPIAAAGIGLRLAPTTSAHPGLAQATGPGPTMAFTAPPVFSVQTRPIYAVGL
jgi:hypothetical protein